MLTAKGYEVSFRLESKREIHAPKRYGMLHDPSGRDWNKNSILVAPFRRMGEEIQSDPAEEYFGYVPKAGRIHLPPRTLGAWNYAGEVAEIDYWRPGEHEAEYFHPFENGGWRFESKPRLYRRSRIFRLELGPGAKLNWRGFIYP